jgi:hypothetical protein
MGNMNAFEENLGNRMNTPTFVPHTPRAEPSLAASLSSLGGFILKLKFILFIDPCSI